MISRTDAQQSIVHLKRLLHMPVAVHTYAKLIKIYHVVQELFAFSLTGSGRTDGLTHWDIVNYAQSDVVLCGVRPLSLSTDGLTHWDIVNYAQSDDSSHLQANQSVR